MIFEKEQAQPGNLPGNMLIILCIETAQFWGFGHFQNGFVDFVGYFAQHGNGEIIAASGTEAAVFYLFDILEFTQQRFLF